MLLVQLSYKESWRIVASDKHTFPAFNRNSNPGLSCPWYDSINYTTLKSTWSPLSRHSFSAPTTTNLAIVMLPYEYLNTSSMLRLTPHGCNSAEQAGFFCSFKGLSILALCVACLEKIQVHFILFLPYFMALDGSSAEELQNSYPLPPQENGNCKDLMPHRGRIGSRAGEEEGRKGRPFGTWGISRDL